MKQDKGNQNKNKKGNKKNLMGLISMLCWALFFTLLIKSCTGSYKNANVIQVPYTTFKTWLVEDKIAQVNVESGQYSFTLREGVEVELPKQEESTAQKLMDSLLPFQPTEQKNSKYITVPLYGVDDPELMALLDQHTESSYTKLVDGSTYILSFVITSILPMIIMVALMMFMYRSIGGKGGVGGMGGVGKANAKVYVEKKTGYIPENTPRLVPSCPRAHCWLALPVPVRPCWPRPLPVKPVFPSSPFPVPISSRCL